jgi:hypothetical protein
MCSLHRRSSEVLFLFDAYFPVCLPSCLFGQPLNRIQSNTGAHSSFIYSYIFLPCCLLVHVHTRKSQRTLFLNIKQPIFPVFLCLLVSRYAVKVVYLSSRLHHIDCTLCSYSSGCRIIYLAEGMTHHIATDVRLTFSTCTLVHWCYM